MFAAPFASEPPLSSRASLTWSECNQLAAAIRCLPGRWEAQWDRDDRGHVSVALLQDDDGVIGAATRNAIREMQVKYGLPADGYPTMELLAALQGRG